MGLELQSARVAHDITVVKISGSITAGQDNHAVVPFVQDLLQKGEVKLVLDL